MNVADAEEYTAALGQVVAGSYRQVALGVRLGVPQALGLSVPDWVEHRLGGYVRLSIPERRDAVAELAGEGMTQRQIADVLGVGQSTVDRDQRDPSGSSDDGEQGELLDPDPYGSEPVWAPVVEPAELEDRRRRQVISDNLRSALVVLDPIDIQVDARATYWLDHLDPSAFDADALRRAAELLTYLADHWRAAA